MKVYSIELTKQKKGYCPTICKSRPSAEKELVNLERNTGLKWKIIERESSFYK